jgi:hypothetical protein
MPFRGGDDGDRGGEDPEAENERVREEEASWKVQVSEAAGDGQRSTTSETVTLMLEGLIVWCTLTLLHDAVVEELCL